MSGARITQRHVASAEDVAYAEGKGLLVPLEEVDDPRVGGWVGGWVEWRGCCHRRPRPLPRRRGGGSGPWRVGRDGATGSGAPAWWAAAVGQAPGCAAAALV
jgi:hypothetical protein